MLRFLLQLFLGWKGCGGVGEFKACFFLQMLKSSVIQFVWVITGEICDHSFGLIFFLWPCRPFKILKKLSVIDLILPCLVNTFSLGLGNGGSK